MHFDETSPLVWPLCDVAQSIRFASEGPMGRRFAARNRLAMERTIGRAAFLVDLARVLVDRWGREYDEWLTESMQEPKFGPHGWVYSNPGPAPQIDSQTVKRLDAELAALGDRAERFWYEAHDLTPPTRIGGPPAEPAEGDWLTTDEVVELLKIKRRQVERLARSGEITAKRRKGGAWLCHRPSVLSYRRRREDGR